MLQRTTTEEMFHSNKEIHAIGIVAAFSLSLFGSSIAFAAQGQITEVNPSGVHGTITDLDTGEVVAFTVPKSKQPAGWPPELGEVVSYDLDCRGAHCFADGVSEPSHEPGAGTP